jgi:KipI family sensor histidine kinase inhibitor
MSDSSAKTFPQIRAAGVDGLLVRFAGGLGEDANRAALAFRAAVEAENWPGVEECSTALVSVFLRFDPFHLAFADLRAKVDALLFSQDWLAAPLPGGRRRFRIPAVFGGDLGPQLDRAAAQAGMGAEDAIASLCAAPLRVMTIGFAPGQPYLGILPEPWDIPRQTDLTPRVTEGALVVAIRQVVLFSVDAPTGWSHVGQTAARLFSPDRERPFLLAPGDEARFVPVPQGDWDGLRADPDGGVTSERLP